MLSHGWIGKVVRALLGPDMRSRERGTDRLGSLSDASEITENALAKGTRSSRTVRSVEASPYATASPIVTSRRVANACSAKSSGKWPLSASIPGYQTHRQCAVRNQSLPHRCTYRCASRPPHHVSYLSVSTLRHTRARNGLPNDRYATPAYRRPSTKADRYRVAPGSTFRGAQDAAETSTLFSSSNTNPS